jgi:hypothetical protein
MILPDFTIPSRIDQNCEYTGMDSPDLCLDSKHFKSYPYSVSYQYNSRGYRDHEWPDDLQRAVWCIGDSFTVGIGSPVEHTWSRILESKTGLRTINISMDGASNNWIARHAVKILNIVKPKVMVMHWSYLHRREGITHINAKAKSSFLNHYKNIKDPSWPDIKNVENFGSLPIYIQNELLNLNDDTGWRKKISDEELRLWHIRSEIHEDISNTVECVDLVDYHQQDSRIIHSFIPEFIGGDRSNFYQQLKTDNPVIQELQRLDLSRDGHHYDIKTSENFVQQIMQVLN